MKTREKNEIKETKTQELNEIEKERKAYFSHETDARVQYYPYTHRPVTKMKTMCRKQIRRKEFGNRLFLPVVRYYLYHSKTPEQDLSKIDKGYCGTFFFFEPHSINLLDLGQTAVFGSKVHAFYALNRAVLGEQEMNISSLFTDVLDRITDWLPVLESTYGDLTPGHYRTTLGQSDVSEDAFDQFLHPFYFPVFNYTSDVSPIRSLGGTAMYPTDRHSYLYRGELGQSALLQMQAGVHDELDQNICHVARYLKLDSVLIQREVGEFDTVTEILDTRPDSYDHLYCYTKEKDDDATHSDRKTETMRIATTQPPFMNNSVKYPKVWFFQEQSYVYDKQRIFDIKINTNHFNRIEYKILNPLAI